MSGRHNEMVRAALAAMHAPPHGRSPEEYMRCALAAGLRVCKPSLGPGSASRLMEGDFQQIANGIADELEAE